MKPTTFFAILSICLNCNLVIAQTKPNTNFGLTAIERIDNDFVTTNDISGKKAPIPLNVDLRIEKLLEICRNSNSYLESHGSKVTIPVIFKITYNADVDIYIVKFASFDNIAYKLIAYNIHTKLASDKAPSILGNFMEDGESTFDKQARLLSKPLIHFEDINHDGKKYIVIKEREHNGTVYNAVVEHYYSLDEHMNFDQKLCIETSYADPFNTSRLISRQLRGNDLISYLTKDGKTSVIGDVKLNLNSPRKVVSKKCYKSEYADLLITGRGINEETFLKRGHTFQYF
jgi:hypothetical protein